MSNNQAPDLIAAAREAEYLFAHGVGAMSNDSKNSERNISEARRISAALREALAAVPADARIAPRQLLLDAADVIDEVMATIPIIEGLRQAAGEAK